MIDNSIQMIVELGDIFLRVKDQKRFELINYRTTRKDGNLYGWYSLKEEFGEQVHELPEADFKPKHFLNIGKHQ